MPRRKAATKREILPDPLYGSERLAKFINVVMRRGKRSVAEMIVYNALNNAAKRLNKNKATKKPEAEGDVAGRAKLIQNKEGYDALEKALHNVRPTVEIKSRRVGGATYQVPIEVDVERGVALAMRWVIKAAKARGEKTMVDRLAAEIVDAFEGRGASVKMRDDTHRMAKANQAFAHYRW